MTPRPPIRQASAADLSRLLDLMADFYAESAYVLDRARAEEAFTALLSDPRLGRVWLIEQGSDDVGYVVVTFVFAMEYGGLTAVVDDFYVEPASRNAGLGTVALALVRRICVGFGMRAMSVEVGHDNAVAQAVYRRVGFLETDRQLMTLRLADPSHVEEPRAAGRPDGYREGADFGDEEATMSRVIHFEIHASNPEALIDFYTALLGWSFTKQEAMDYWLIETGPADQPGINGGLVRRPVAGPAESQAVNAFICTVQVDSLDETLQTNADLGGVVALPKMPIPGIGWLAYIKDTDGNMLGLLQPDEAAA